MSVYKISCEWDMGESWEETVFNSIEKAEASIKSADWEGLVGMSLEEVQDQGLVNIHEVDMD